MKRALAIEGWRSLEGLEIKGVQLQLEDAEGRERVIDLSEKAVAAVLLWGAGRHFRPEMVMFLTDIARLAAERGKNDDGAKMLRTIAGAIDELLPPWKKARPADGDSVPPELPSF